MPYVNAALHLANHTFAPIEEVDSGRLRPPLREADSLVELADKLGLFEVLAEERRTELQAFLASTPPSLDAAIRAAVESAVQRGIHTQLVWQPAYDWRLEVWEVSAEEFEAPGALTILISAPHPYEAPAEAPAKSR